MSEEAETATPLQQIDFENARTGTANRSPRLAAGIVRATVPDATVAPVLRLTSE